MTNLSFLPDVAEITYEKILACYDSDAARFARVISNPGFANVVSVFTSDVPPVNTNIKFRGKIPESMRIDRCLDVNQYSNWLGEIIAAAQVAVCCNLFRGNSIYLERFNENRFRAFARNGVQRYLQSDSGGLRILSKHIEVTDGIRIMTILRCMGLFHRTSNHIRQLSLGASSGIRELDALHAKLWLQMEASPSIKMSAAKEKSATFNSEYGCPEHVILVDGADECREFYKKLNTQCKESRFGNNILAINKMLDSALYSITKDIEHGIIKERNLVVAFRIDPRMIPDIEVLFSKLSFIIDEGADLIVTIGAGNDAKEFKNRVDKMNEITRFLENRALKPWRIRMYNADLPVTRRCYPLFGIPELMSYDILYCKLKKRNLK